MMTLLISFARLALPVSSFIASREVVVGAPAVCNISSATGTALAVLFSAPAARASFLFRDNWSVEPSFASVLGATSMSVGSKVFPGSSCRTDLPTAPSGASSSSFPKAAANAPERATPPRGRATLVRSNPPSPFVSVLLSNSRFCHSSLARARDNSFSRRSSSFRSRARSFFTRSSSALALTFLLSRARASSSSLRLRSAAPRCRSSSSSTSSCSRRSVIRTGPPGSFLSRSSSLLPRRIVARTSSGGSGGSSARAEAGVTFVRISPGRSSSSCTRLRGSPPMRAVSTAGPVPSGKIRRMVSPL
mmetsp:Transcript_38936/g.90598  ORF Transcript_38936/g.90598 Transcript_38936/m.90598 type:complete len:304 (-) Transcript_38936:886-1797(-)